MISSFSTPYLEGGLRTKAYEKQRLLDQPLITVVTVVFNGEKYLTKTIQNVLQQTYENIEYIIIDGRSKDNTLNIITQFEDKIDYWISEKDKGIYDAMNKGIALAKGDYINFMNAGDCFVNNDVVREVVSKLVAKSPDVLYGNTEEEGSTNTILPRNMRNIWRGAPFCHQSVFIKKEVLVAYPFDLNYKICADYDQVYSLYKAGKKFSYLAQSIAQIEPNEGISRRQRLNLQKENFSIAWKNTKTPFIALFYFYFFIKNYIKQI